MTQMIAEMSSAELLLVYNIVQCVLLFLLWINVREIGHRQQERDRREREQK